MSAHQQIIRSPNVVASKEKDATTPETMVSPMIAFETPEPLSDQEEEKLGSLSLLRIQQQRVMSPTLPHTLGNQEGGRGNASNVNAGMTNQQRNINAYKVIRRVQSPRTSATSTARGGSLTTRTRNLSQGRIIMTQHGNIQQSPNNLGGQTQRPTSSGGNALTHLTQHSPSHPKQGPTQLQRFQWTPRRPMTAKSGAIRIKKKKGTSLTHQRIKSAIGKNVQSVAAGNVSNNFPAQQLQFGEEDQPNNVLPIPTATQPLPPQSQTIEERKLSPTSQQNKQKLDKLQKDIVKRYKMYKNQKYLTSLLMLQGIGAKHPQKSGHPQQFDALIQDLMKRGVITETNKEALETTIQELFKAQEIAEIKKKKKKKRNKSQGGTAQDDKPEKKSKWRRRPQEVHVDIEEGFVDKVKILESKLQSRFKRDKAVIGHHYLQELIKEAEREQNRVQKEKEAAVKAEQSRQKQQELKAKRANILNKYKENSVAMNSSQGARGEKESSSKSEFERSYYGGISSSNANDLQDLLKAKNEIQELDSISSMNNSEAKILQLFDKDKQNLSKLNIDYQRQQISVEQEQLEQEDLFDKLDFDEYDYNSITFDLKQKDKIIIDDDVLEHFKRLTRKPQFLHFNDKEDKQDVKYYVEPVLLPLRRQKSLVEKDFKDIDLMDDAKSETSQPSFMFDQERDYSILIDPPKYKEMKRRLSLSLEMTLSIFKPPSQTYSKTGQLAEIFQKKPHLLIQDVSNTKITNLTFGSFQFQDPEDWNTTFLKYVRSDEIEESKLFHKACKIKEHRRIQEDLNIQCDETIETLAQETNEAHILYKLEAGMQQWLQPLQDEKYYTKAIPVVRSSTIRSLGTLKDFRFSKPNMSRDPSFQKQDTTKSVNPFQKADSITRVKTSPPYVKEIFEGESNIEKDLLPEDDEYFRAQSNEVRLDTHLQLGQEKDNSPLTPNLLVERLVTPPGMELQKQTTQKTFETFSASSKGVTQNESHTQDQLSQEEENSEDHSQLSLRRKNEEIKINLKLATPKTSDKVRPGTIQTQNVSEFRQASASDLDLLKTDSVMSNHQMNASPNSNNNKRRPSMYFTADLTKMVVSQHKRISKARHSSSVYDQSIEELDGIRIGRYEFSWDAVYRKRLLRKNSCTFIFEQKKGLPKRRMSEDYWIPDISKRRLKFRFEHEKYYVNCQDTDLMLKELNEEIARERQNQFKTFTKSGIIQSDIYSKESIEGALNNCSRESSSKDAGVAIHPHIQYHPYQHDPYQASVNPNAPMKRQTILFSDQQSNLQFATTMAQTQITTAEVRKQLVGQVQTRLSTSPQNIQNQLNQFNQFQQYQKKNTIGLAHQQTNPHDNSGMVNVDEEVIQDYLQYQMQQQQQDEIAQFIQPNPNRRLYPREIVLRELMNTNKLINALFIFNLESTIDFKEESFRRRKWKNIQTQIANMFNMTLDQKLSKLRVIVNNADKHGWVPLYHLDQTIMIKLQPIVSLAILNDFPRLTHLSQERVFKLIDGSKYQCRDPSQKDREIQAIQSEIESDELYIELWEELHQMHYYSFRLALKRFYFYRNTLKIIDFGMVYKYQKMERKFSHFLYNVRLDNYDRYKTSKYYTTNYHKKLKALEKQMRVYEKHAEAEMLFCNNDIKKSVRIRSPKWTGIEVIPRIEMPKILRLKMENKYVNIALCLYRKDYLCYLQIFINKMLRESKKYLTVKPIYLRKLPSHQSSQEHTMVVLEEDELQSPVIKQKKFTNNIIEYLAPITNDYNLEGSLVNTFGFFSFIIPQGNIIMHYIEPGRKILSYRMEDLRFDIQAVTLVLREQLEGGYNTTTTSPTLSVGSAERSATGRSSVSPRRSTIRLQLIEQLSFRQRLSQLNQTGSNGSNSKEVLPFNADSQHPTIDEGSSSSESDKQSCISSIIKIQDQNESFPKSNLLTPAGTNKKKRHTVHYPQKRISSGDIDPNYVFGGKSSNSEKDIFEEGEEYQFSSDDESKIKQPRMQKQQFLTPVSTGKIHYISKGFRRFPGKQPYMDHQYTNKYTPCVSHQRSYSLPFTDIKVRKQNTHVISEVTVKPIQIQTQMLMMDRLKVKMQSTTISHNKRATLRKLYQSKEINLEQYKRAKTREREEHKKTKVKITRRWSYNPPDPNPIMILSPRETELIRKVVKQAKKFIAVKRVLSVKRAEYVKAVISQVNDDTHSFELYNEDISNINHIKHFKDLSQNISLYTEEDSIELSKAYIPEMVRKTKSFKLKRTRNPEVIRRKSIHIESEIYAKPSLLGPESLHTKSKGHEPQMIMKKLVKGKKKVKGVVNFGSSKRKQSIYSDSKHARIIFDAIKSKNLLDVQEKLKRFGGVSFEQRDLNGNTMLNVAVQSGSIDITETLLKRGAYVNSKNDSGNTPLHYAIAYNFKPILNLLIQYKADQKIRNNNKRTPWEGI